MLQSKYLHVGVIALVSVLFVALGCGEEESMDGETAETESVAQAVTSCHPDPGYDYCHQFDMSNLEYWQHTLPDPDWRTVEPVGTDGIDYRVTIDAFELNGGLVPTAQGQGEYSSWQEYADTKNQLLGVDVTSNVVSVVIEHPTVKLDDNGEPTVDTTGIFTVEALSDENGEIWVDNQNVTADLYSERERHNHSIVLNGNPVTSASTSSAQDNTILEAGPWEAKATLSSFIWTGGVLRTVINDVDKEGNRCLWDFVMPSLLQSTSPDMLVLQCEVADKLQIHSYSLENATQNIADDEVESDYSTSSLSHEIHTGWPYVEGCSNPQADFDIPNYAASGWLFVDGNGPHDCPPSQQ